MAARPTRAVHPGELVLKIYGETFVHDSRDQRELETVRELGLRALVLTKGRRNETTDNLDCEWKIIGTRPLGDSRWMVLPNRLWSLLTWAREVRRIEPAVISGHDLIGTLIGWMSTWFMASARKPVLIYDAHELIVGLYYGWRRYAISALEGFLMRRSTLSIAVNDSIADRMRDLHRAVDRPVVVRSVPRRWTLDHSKVVEHRQEILRELGLEDDGFLLMYHGAVFPDRGIESCIRLLEGRTNVGLIILGNGERDYHNDLRCLATEIGVVERVLFRSAVPLERLGDYVAAADVGMVTVPRTAESYYLMLPNKFFENIQAETPMIVSDFPEVGAIVRRYDIGILVDPSDLAQMGSAVDQLRQDTAMRARLRQNLALAKAELCWENEQQRLKNVYQGLMA